MAVDILRIRDKAVLFFIFQTEKHLFTIIVVNKKVRLIHGIFKMLVVFNRCNFFLLKYITSSYADIGDVGIRCPISRGHETRGS